MTTKRPVPQGPAGMDALAIGQEHLPGLPSSSAQVPTYLQELGRAFDCYPDVAPDMTLAAVSSLLKLVGSCDWCVPALEGVVALSARHRDMALAA